MLYTGRGDKGTTSHMGSPKRVAKTDAVIEALGTLDELNSLLGLCKVKALGSQSGAFVARIQEDLFIVQAEVAGSNKRLAPEKTLWLEEKTNAIEAELPPIKTFFVSGGTERSALFDLARTVARRAERRLVALHAETPLGDPILSYMNRLSSLLYALARRENKESGITELPPTYQ